MRGQARARTRREKPDKGTCKRCQRTNIAMLSDGVMWAHKRPDGGKCLDREGVCATCGARVGVDDDGLIVAHKQARVGRARFSDGWAENVVGQEYVSGVDCSGAGEKPEVSE